MRGLSKVMKRAFVLMALDAAGISTDAVLEDAKRRMEAIDSYEAAQRKLFEAEWARRAEENVQIQSELESLKARYMDRLKCNQDAITRDKLPLAVGSRLNNRKARAFWKLSSCV
jgi:hypothetical protein